MNAMEEKMNQFIGYEYKDVTVSRDMVSVYADGYANFGWTLEGTTNSVSKIGMLILKLKRDRKIKDKGELVKLERQFTACASEIESLELAKSLKASVVAYVIGVIGTAFMAGSVFAYLGDLIALCIALAVPAFVGWIIPYWCFRGIQRKKTAEATPLIDKKYEEIYEICRQANGLIVN